MKRLSTLPVAGVVAMISAQAVATAQPTDTAKQDAYSIALMCNAVAAYYRDDPAFMRTNDAVKKMGRVLGYNLDRTSKDMLDMASALGIRQRKEPGSMAASQARCRRIGFAS